ncbi:fimbria/pilus outer membrane usher protein [Altericroceibacterium endophyticum]|uniref:Fimbria/pilus outer membrane usher protein n=1 Tax=Altericroceibacterium endophyticum TaxID=1808508 RepID=A0A6I4SZG2_9SPHN|nr:fimbria/pilus outer membrane usher protein [Altericroceibacterium endophyticum]MXO64144.1 fimbria/pilus outer membrane usher protein [Altericroceibacterium endophyticum]
MGRKNAICSRAARRIADLVAACCLTLCIPFNASAAARLDDRPTQAGGLPPAAVEDEPGEKPVPLYLAVTVNGVQRGVAPFEMLGSRIRAAPLTLSSLGLRVEVDNPSPLSLDDLSWLSTRYDAGRQAIELFAPAERLLAETAYLNQLPEDNPPILRGQGALLNFDLAANLVRDTLSMNGYGNLRLFSGDALFENSGLWRQTSGPQKSGSAFLRFDSTAQFSLPDRKLQFQLGDVTTIGSRLGRATRIGGLRVGSDFSLQPYFVSTPLPAFLGSAILPSSVDLYINGLKRYSGNIAPGPFELSAGQPQISGAGTAQVVLTDILGRSVTLDFPIYDSESLLRKGVSEWSFAAGTLRRDYGIRSFAYQDDVLASADWRHGVSDSLSVASHGEWREGMLNLGAEAQWLKPTIGLLSAGLSASSRQGRKGYRYRLGYSWMDSRFSISADIERANEAYADIAATYGVPFPTIRDRFRIGYTTRSLGSYSAGLLRQKIAGKGAETIASAYWSKSFSSSLSVNMSGNYAFGQSGYKSVFLTLSYSPGSRAHYSASFNESNRSRQALLSARRSADYDGGAGWRMQLLRRSDDVELAGQADYLTDFGRFTAGGRTGQASSAFATYRGALVAMDGGLHAAREINDGFAIVSVPGREGVPVRLQNREYGVTGKDGTLLVTGLNAYQHNRIEIDPSKLPPNLEIKALVKDVVPARKAGASVRFEMQPGHWLMMHVADESGNYLAVGSQAESTLTGKRFHLGYDGMLYIEQAQAGDILIIQVDDGACQVTLPDSIPSERLGRLGDVTCAETIDARH